MRLALLSALADPSASVGERPAFRRFAGKSVLAHQIDCAALLGCQRILCLAPGRGPDLAAAKSYAERNALKFEAVDTILHVAAHVTADDEVVCLADGILPDRAELMTALGEQRAVLAFPDDPALAQGFERLDATRAWSGALRARGESVARLGDLPPDCDMASSLLRTALQAGTRIVELDPGLIVEGTWQRRVERQGLAVREQRWITRQVRLATFRAPGLALAERVGLRWSRDVGGGRWARAPHGAAAVLAAGAVAGWYAGWPVAALALLLFALTALAIASVFDRVEALGAKPGKRDLLFPVARWIADGLLVLALSSLVLVVPAWLGIALPVLLVGVLRLGERNANSSWRALFADRISLLAVLTPAAYAGMATAAVAALTAAGLLFLLWDAPKPAGVLTTD